MFLDTRHEQQLKEMVELYGICGILEVLKEICQGEQFVDWQEALSEAMKKGLGY